MTRNLRRINTWLRLLLVLGAGAPLYCGAAEQPVRAAEDLPSLRMEQFTLENRLANLRGKHPLLTNAESMHDLRLAEHAVLGSPEVHTNYQAARSRIFPLALQAFPALSTMVTARPALEDEAFGAAAAGLPTERETRQEAMQAHFANFDANSLYVSDWCQLDVLMLCGGADPTAGNALQRARRAALSQITNGASPGLIAAALDAYQLEGEAFATISRMQELNSAIAKFPGGKTAHGQGDAAEYAFMRMQLATSSVRLDERMILFPATELLASMGNDALSAVPAYLDRLEALAKNKPAETKSSFLTRIAPNKEWVGGAGKFFRRWSGWGAVGLVLIFVICAFQMNADLREHRKRILIYCVIILVAMVGGWFLGHSTGHRWAGVIVALLLGGIASLGLLRTLDRAINDSIGGLIFDMIFSEGSFADRGRKVSKAPNLALLRHWRDEGMAMKAFRAARPYLRNDASTYPLWLFAAETCALHLDKIRQAERIMAKLCSKDAFDNSQKLFALQSFKSWAASQGYHVDIAQFDMTRSNIQRPRPLYEAEELRQRGLFREAEAKLELLHEESPENLASATALMRLYTQDLRERNKAERILAQLVKQGEAPEAWVEYMKRSLNEWEALAPVTTERKRSWLERFSSRSRKPAPPSTIVKKIVLDSPPDEVPEEMTTAAPPPGATAEECFAKGFIGTGMEILEQAVKNEPKNFDRRLKLAMAHFHRTHNRRQAESVLRNVLALPDFTPEEKEQAREILKGWQ